MVSGDLIGGAEGSVKLTLKNISPSDLKKPIKILITEDQNASANQNEAPMPSMSGSAPPAMKAETTSNNVPDGTNLSPPPLPGGTLDEIKKQVSEGMEMESGEEEIKENNRARSAKLRVAEKI